MNDPCRNSGFSLVEVMCAILILGIALAGLTQGVTTALTSSKESELQTTAALFAAGLVETPPRRRELERRSHRRRMWRGPLAVSLETVHHQGRD